MARPLRIEYPGAWHHVMNRGRRAEKIFYGNQDRRMFVGLLEETVEEWNIRISENKKDWVKRYRQFVSIEDDEERSPFDFNHGMDAVNRRIRVSWRPLGMRSVRFAFLCCA